jgi:hypothetical protein
MTYLWTWIGLSVGQSIGALIWGSSDLLAAINFSGIALFSHWLLCGRKEAA